MGRRKVLVSDGAEWKKGEDSEGSWIKDTTCRVVAARLRVNRTRVSLSLRYSLRLRIFHFVEVFLSSIPCLYTRSVQLLLVAKSLVGIDRSIDRSKLCLFFLSFFFFFIPRFTRAPKLSMSLTTSGEANDIRLTRSTTAVTGNPSVFTLHGGFLDRANAEGNRRHVNDVDEQKFERSQLECSPMREFHRRSFRRVLLLPRPRPPPPPPPSDLQISPGR